MKSRLVHLLLLILGINVAVAQDFVPIPTINRPVVDTADVLTSGQEQELERSIFGLESEKGSQIVVVTVLTTEPETIEQYTIRLTDKWKVGRKGVNDGVLLLIAISDKVIRIEAGYGLEGAIPDAIAKRIIEDGILPYFRSGQLFEGIKVGVELIEKRIRGEPLPEPTKWNTGDDSPHFMLLFGAGIFISFLLSMFMQRVIAASISAGIIFCVGLFIYPVLLSAIYAAVVWILSLGTAGGRGGSYTYGGGRGGFSGGGGWSAGGGSFGGGGASGRW